MSSITDLGTKLHMQENRLFKKKKIIIQGKVLNSALLFTTHTSPLTSAHTWTDKDH